MFVYRELAVAGSLRRLRWPAAETTAVVMFLVAAAMVSAWLITIAELPGQVAALLEPFMGNKTLLMLAMMVLVVIVGTALDMLPTILILTPVLMPIVKQAGIDPIYFGVLFIINNAIGLLTPPVGTVLNVVCGVTKVKMDDIIKGVWPFMIAQLARPAAADPLPAAGHRAGELAEHRRDDDFECQSSMPQATDPQMHARPHRPASTATSLRARCRR